MKYKWRVSELQRIREQAIKIKDKATAYDMNSMINLMKSSMDPDDFNIVAEQNHFNFKESFANFCSLLSISITDDGSFFLVTLSLIVMRSMVDCFPLLSAC